jgi:hypothetical protein
MIRRVYTALGSTVFFVIGTDKAIKRFVAMSTGQVLNPAPRRPAKFSAEWYAEGLDARARRR